MIIPMNPSSVDDYRLFLKAKALPRYRVRGGFVEIPDEYADQLGMAPPTDVAETHEQFALFSEPG